MLLLGEGRVSDFCLLCCVALCCWYGGVITRSGEVQHIQATVRFEAGSVYFVLLGSGLAGWLGVSCSGWGVLSSAMIIDMKVVRGI